MFIRCCWARGVFVEFACLTTKKAPHHAIIPGSENQITQIAQMSQIAQKNQGCHLLFFCAICGILRYLRSTGYTVVKAQLTAPELAR